MRRFATLALVLCALPIRADTIRLKNGNAVEGRIVAETSTDVTLDLGGGTMRLPRSSIATIERSDARANERIEAEWKDRYFLSDKFVPPALRPFAQRFRNLESRRDDAVRARRRLAVFAQDEQRLVADLDGTMKKLVEVSRRLQIALPQEDPAEYNAIVVESNQLRAAITVKQHEIAVHQKQLPPLRDAIAAYMTELTTFQQDVETAEASIAASDEDLRRFLERVARRTSEFAGEMRESIVAVKVSPKGLIVQVVVNGSVEGTFLVDTGAALVSMSAAFARRLKLATGAADTVEVVLADGSRVPALAVSLQTVKVGDALARDIPAVVLPQATGEGIDGLLGMAFLRNFHVTLSGASGSLVLREFNPR